MPQSSALPTYSAIYAFGDSLSDAGNVSILTATVGTEPVSPPYAQEKYGSATGNVFSNGPTWVQDLSGALGLGTLAPSLANGNDFAYGGAETGSTPQNSGNPQIGLLSLPAQLQQFQAKVTTPAANALYTISIGGNDLFDVLDSSGLTAQQQTADVTAAVTNEISFVNQLVGDGAKNLMVMDVPDLGKTPSYSQGGSAAEATQLSSEYDTALVSQLASIASTDSVRIDVINAFQLIDQAVADPAGYGLTNVTSPVWTGNFTSASSGTLVSSDPTVQDQYLFFDHEHPTETGHLALATLAEDELGGNGVVALPTGNQYYQAAAGTTVLTGGGNDTVSATAGQVTVIGGLGTLTFVGGTGASSVTGSTGAVTIFGGSGGGSFGGGAGGPNILISQGAAGANTTLVGGASGDQIFGSAAGDDLLVASVGRDSILGGGGSTTIDGGASAGSVIFTGAGATTVDGGAAGGDTIVGGSGSTNVVAAGDAIFGTSGALQVSGSTTRADSIIGGAGALSVTGRGGNMLVVAATSTSSITTGNGASLILASSGATSVTGGSGSLQVLLGAGTATVTEGAGAALFDVVKGAAGGTDVINGFKTSTDHIQLFGYAPSDLSVTTSNGSSFVSLTDGTKIQVVGVTDLGGSIS